MATRVNYLAYVKRSFKRTDKDTEIYEALDETINDIASRHPFQVLQYQLHLSHPIRILEGGATNDDGWPLEQLTKEQYDWYEGNPNRTSPSTGRPWGYTIFSDSILLTDIPDSQGWQIEINWGKNPTLPTADGDTAHPFGTVWDETVKWGILARMYEQIGLGAESDRFSQLYEVGRPIAVGGRVTGHQGGIANMIKVDQEPTSMPIVVVPNTL
jgi:hypothetical protein